MNTTYGLPHQATIQISCPDGTRRSLPCVVEGLDGKRLNVRSQDRVPGSIAATIECNDAMFLGEVVACTRDADDSWRLQLHVEQVLTGLQSLITLRARLLGEPVPEMSPATIDC